MKDGLENIDEVFKQAFDGFEANVDPSVWNNIQNSISSGSGGSSTPQVDPSTVAGVAGKSLAMKIVAGVAIIGTVATSAYFIPDLFKENETAIAENNVVDDNTIEVIEETNSVVVEEQNGTATENIAVETEENTVVNNNLAVEPNRTERSGNVDVVSSDDGAETQSEESNLNVESSDILTKEEAEAKNLASKIEKPIKAEEKIELSVKMSVTTSKGEAPLEVVFDAYGDAVKYHWDFGDDLGKESGESIDHTFFNEGTYTVKLTGQDVEGNTMDVYQRIIVEKSSTSSLEPIRKWFSPNGDGINDIIKFKGKNIDKIEVRVMDSRGKTVYSTKLIDDVWDGKDQSGNYLVQGYYRIVVAAKGKDGKDHVIRQMINLRN